jgi:DNA-binding transcriptional MocR family regulator
LVNAVERELDGLLEVRPDEAGMDLMGWLPENIDAKEAARQAADEGVEVIPLVPHGMPRLKRGALRLGYTGYTPRALRRGVRQLANALRKVRAASS